MSAPRYKELTVEKIASLVKKPSVGKLKTKSPSIQSSKRTNPKSVTKVFVKGGALPSIKKLTTEKIANRIKKLSAEKTKTKSSSIQSSKCTIPKSVTKVSVKGRRSTLQYKENGS